MAEDHEDDVLLVKAVFRRLRVENPLVVVNNGEQVLHYLRGQAPFVDRAQFPFPALLFLDLTMPDLSGFQVLSELKKDPALLERLPVIVLTSSLFAGDIKLAYELGAKSFINKSPDLNLLTQSIHQALLFWLGERLRSSKPEEKAQTPQPVVPVSNPSP